jgi:hypothetical protein
VRINANLVRTEPSTHAAAGVRLRTQGAAALRDALADEAGVRRYIYDGMLSREQAARGAVIGQYVRIAQSAARDDVGQQLPPQCATLDSAVLRRDLIGSMFQQMTGELAGWPAGMRVATFV